MNKPLLLTGIIAVCFTLNSCQEKPGKERKAHKDLNEPYDFLFHQRAYPDAAIDMKAFDAAMQDAKLQMQNAGFNKMAAGSWTVEGPGNIGGRINCVAVQSNNSNIIYAGTACGGIFKTTNGGTSWNPIFDGQSSLSIGAITIDPSNNQTIWAGTGDPNISGYPFIGDGIYKSTNGGSTWTNMGLGFTRITSKIIVDPGNSNIVYAATMGIPFVRDTARGLYKSTNGGTSWTKILYVDNDAGIIDLIMDPANSQVLYASSWNRIRNNTESLVHGPDGKIWKSTNGGATWTALSNGLPNFPVCRIGLAISPQSSNVLYAVVVDSTLFLEGVYKSTNAGSSWTSLPISSFDQGSMAGFAWYFGKIYVNPTNQNQIYVPGVEMQTTTDGGVTWTKATPPWWTYQVHADGHFIHFVNGNHLLYCTDGGLYETTDNCLNWTDIEDLPNTQFYHVGFDPNNPNDYFGGAQDNGTTGGNTSNFNNWPRIFGGDGFTPIFDPTTNQVYYVETQNGSLWYTDDAGNTINDFTIGLDTGRKSWDMPYIMSAQNSSTFYCGTSKMYTMTGAPYGTWQAISNDLTDGIIYDPRFHVISTVAESGVNGNLLYAGTSDANVWASWNQGSSWTNVTGSLPNRYVTSVKASPNVAKNVYVAHSGYKYNDFIPHIHKSIDSGKTWQSIAGNLPQFAINDILILPGSENVIITATDAGVYATVDAGVSWNRVGNNMPIMPVYDLELNTTLNRLIAGTFARSIWSFDVNDITGMKEKEIDKNDLVVYPNPSNGRFSVSISSNEATIKIFNLNGQEVRITNDLKIDISDQAPGIYLLQVETVKGRSVTKIVLQ